MTDRRGADEQARERARVARRRAEIEMRASMSPPGRAPDRLRVGTWNLNSLRARIPAVERLLDRLHPDVLCLQETKAASLPDATVARFGHYGYRILSVGTGAYNGVAIATCHAITDAQVSGEFGVEVLDREPRLVTCIVGTAPPLRVASVYVPHGRAVGHWHYEYKLEFLGALADLVHAWMTAGEHVVLAGDVNVAATDSDVFHPDAFVGATHVTLAERDALEQLFDTGLVDVDVACWGARARRFTWWKPGFGYEKNLGMRLDVIAVDATTGSAARDDLDRPSGAKCRSALGPCRADRRLPPRRR